MKSSEALNSSLPSAYPAGKDSVEDAGDLQLKYTPYVLIGVFALLALSLRFYMLPDWNPLLHLLAFLYQCLVLTGFWHLIKFIHRKLNTYYPFDRGVIKRMALQNLLTILAIAAYSIPGAILLQDLVPDFVDHYLYAVMVMLMLITVFMFNFAFYALHFFNKWRTTVRDKAQLEVQAAELKREKSDLQYHQLKNQVNPHYLFNTLSSLEGLISADPDLALKFIGHMSKVYRYVLQRKENEVGSLEEELSFIAHYIELLHIRYGQGLSIQTRISREAREQGIVTVTLQMLVDNAIKHNRVQSSAPLRVCIRDEGGYLLVRNNKQLRRRIDSSNGMGLQQLRQLYSFLTDRPLIVEERADTYTIKIPLLSLN